LAAEYANQITLTSQGDAMAYGTNLPRIKVGIFNVELSQALPSNALVIGTTQSFIYPTLMAFATASVEEHSRNIRTTAAFLLPDETSDLILSDKLIF
jgi:hypothetical protein